MDDIWVCNLLYLFVVKKVCMEIFQGLCILVLICFVKQIWPGKREKTISLSNSINRQICTFLPFVNLMNFNIFIPEYPNFSILYIFICCALKMCLSRVHLQHWCVAEGPLLTASVFCSLYWRKHIFTGNTYFKYFMF